MSPGFFLSNLVAAIDDPTESTYSYQTDQRRCVWQNAQAKSGGATFADRDRSNHVFVLEFPTHFDAVQKKIWFNHPSSLGDLTITSGDVLGSHKSGLLVLDVVILVLANYVVELRVLQIESVVEVLCPWKKSRTFGIPG